MADHIKPGQIMSLKSALREVAGMVDEAHVYIVNRLAIRAFIPVIKALDELTIGEWHYLRDMLYPNWKQEDWTLDPAQKRRIAELLADFREQVTGQMRLFE